MRVGDAADPFVGMVVYISWISRKGVIHWFPETVTEVQTPRFTQRDATGHEYDIKGHRGKFQTTDHSRNDPEEYQHVRRFEDEDKTWKRIQIEHPEMILKGDV